MDEELLLRGVLQRVRNFFWKDVKKEKPEDVLRISRIVDPLVNRAAKEIFKTYAMELLNESITYIVPAVWGVDRDSELTCSQKEINRVTVPLVEKVIHQFEFRELESDQKFAIGYLVRELLISKVIYMVSQLKNQSIIEHEFDDISKTLLN
ncbi:hypothetical protein ACFL03_13785 [Thermodesulfobacteriota bacterium]